MSKAPEKIYINVHPLGVDYSIVPIPDFGGVEYIRKDALLEWARKAKNTECSTMESTRGYWMAINDLLDKLNSM